MKTMWILVGMVLGFSLFAQQADDLRVELKDFKQESVTWSDNYPDLNLRGVGAGKGKSWKRLAVNIEISDPKASINEDTWVDNLEFHWNVVLALGKHGLDSPTPATSIRFQRTVQYVNVETSRRGNEYWAMVFIPPEVFQRYGRHDDMPDNRILGRVDIVWGRHHLGTVWFDSGKAKMSDKETTRNIANFVSSEDPKPMPYGLLARPETPWSFSSSDSEKLMRLAPVADTK